MNLHIKFNPII